MRSRYDIQLALAERRLPLAVRHFRQRAARLAREVGDDWALLSTQRAPGMKALLEAASGRDNVVELGTASGWTAAALVLDSPTRRVSTFDIFDRPHRDEYWSLLKDDERARIEFAQRDSVAAAGELGDVELLFIDSSHEADATVAEFEAWRPTLADGAIVVFDDYGHPEYPGVREAVRRLALEGEALAGHFRWTHRH